MNGLVTLESTAHHLMSTPVLTVQRNDSVGEAMRLFIENNISAAAVMDEKGNPVGVITKTDIARFGQARDGLTSFNKVSSKTEKNDDTIRPGYRLLSDEDEVEQWMTPVIFSVEPTAKIREVATRMVKDGVHHLFVREKSGGKLLGIISTFTLVERLALALNLMEEKT